jgi:hypothetical protein
VRKSGKAQAFLLLQECRLPRSGIMVSIGVPRVLLFSTGLDEKASYHLFSRSSTVGRCLDLDMQRTVSFGDRNTDGLGLSLSKGL